MNDSIRLAREARHKLGKKEFRTDTERLLDDLGRLKPKPGHDLETTLGEIQTLIRKEREAEWSEVAQRLDEPIKMLHDLPSTGG